MPHLGGGGVFIKFSVWGSARDEKMGPIKSKVCKIEGSKQSYNNEKKAAILIQNQGEIDKNSSNCSMIHFVES